MTAKAAPSRKAKRAAQADGAVPIEPGTILIAVKLDMHGIGGLGPGKIRLLELIDQLGSISAAGRAVPMSYRRAWLIVESLNQMFGEPIVVGKHGGSRGGGAQVTPSGLHLIHCYRTIQRKAAAAFASELKEIDKLLKGLP
jgi:molybdate transport system regulatory protein